MAQLKVFNEINDKLDMLIDSAEIVIHEKVVRVGQPITKEQLMELKGVGESLADQILDLINGE